MNVLRVAAIVACALAPLAGSVSAQGSRYRGPGDLVPPELHQPANVEGAEGEARPGPGHRAPELADDLTR